MPSYLHPGVYVEEVSSGSKPIEAVGTSTAIFIGYNERGPIGKPVLITSWDQYETKFGGLRNIQTSVTGSSFVAGDPMGLAVYAYFHNGGAKAYIVRVVGDTPNAPKKSGGVVRDLGDNRVVITFEAANEGTWGNDLVVKINSKDPDSASNDKFKLEIGSGTGKDFVAREVYSEVVLTDGDAQYIVGLVNDSSNLLTVGRIEKTIETDDVTKARNALNNGDGNHVKGETVVTFGNGHNGSTPGSGDYDDIYALLLKYRAVNTMLLPGLAWDGSTGQAIIENALAHCESMKNRMVVFDLPAGMDLKNENDVTALSLTTSTYAATYYPWPLVTNPFYDSDTNPGAARVLLVSPAAYAAGLWAKTDSRRGVWKAPAGVESGLLGISKLEYTVEDAEQDYLNPQGINALRRLPNYGSVVWGARTRSTKANPEWRYVPVRRTAMFIEESIFNGIQWAVFEPNDHRLWSALRINIESFMNGLYRVGAFQGEKASDAYFVRCGLGQTMTQGDIDRGQVIVQIGFAPLKPAEFVIVRIQQKVGQQ